MTNRLRLLLGIVLACWSTGQPLAGQEFRSGSRNVDSSGPSHILLKAGLNDPASAERFLKERLKDAKVLKQQQDNQAKSLMERWLAQPENLEKFKKALEQEQTRNQKLSEKALPDLAKKLAEKFPLPQPLPGSADPATSPTLDQVESAKLEQLMRMLRQKTGAPPKFEPYTSPPVSADQTGPPRPADRTDKSKQSDTTPEQSSPPKEKPKPSQPTRERSSMEAEWTKRFLEWAERSGLNNTLARFPAWNRLSENLNRMAQGEGMDSSFLDRLGGSDSFLNRWGLNKLWSPESWSLTSRLPDMTLPKFRFPEWTPSWGRGGSSASESTSSALPSAPSPSVWRGLLWGAIVLGGGVLLWRVLNKVRAATATGADRRAGRLGPWPVRPEQVRTWGDLILAFEHLSLLLLGTGARNWNHLQIAAGLGDTAAATEQRRRAAEHLARLYEQARYTPAPEPLSEGDVAGARRDLCLLAGVSAA